MSNKSSLPQNIQSLPPVVTVLGHVDHGKTTLLDVIRKTSIAEREHGGITQRIGASRIEIIHDGKKRQITFIDTPGHEAFSLMRGRGVQAADIALLVVSSSDGVMPQTKESIDLLQSTKTPFIVVFTKADLPDKQTEKIKQQLLRENVMLEGLGGEVPFIEVSARTGIHIKELLDLILLLDDLSLVSERAASVKRPLSAVVIESKLDSKTGSRATVVIKTGSLKLRDELFVKDINARVRSLIDTTGKQVQYAGVGDVVEILGFEDVPQVGSLVYKKIETQKNPVNESVTPEKQLAASFDPSALFQKNLEKQKLTVIICADTQGSLEAIINSLPQDEITIIEQKTGNISEADVFLAKSVGAIVLGFNTKIRSEVASLAMTEKILMKNYTIIYELLDEVKDVLEGKALALEEKIFGQAQILARFPFEKLQVCGVKVVDGRVAKGDKVRILRGEEVVGESTISSVRQGKNQTSKVEKGQEAGVILSPQLDFTIGDMLICHD